LIEKDKVGKTLIKPTAIMNGPIAARFLASETEARKLRSVDGGWRGGRPCLWRYGWSPVRSTLSKASARRIRLRCRLARRSKRSDGYSFAGILRRTERVAQRSAELGELISKTSPILGLYFLMKLPVAAPKNAHDVAGLTEITVFEMMMLEIGDRMHCCLRPRSPVLGPYISGRSRIMPCTAGNDSVSSPTSNSGP